MIKQLRYVFAAGGIVAGFFGASGVANATTCQVIQSTIANLTCTGTCITNYQKNHPECFGGTSSTAGASQSIGSTSLQQMLSVSSRAVARFTAFQSPQGAVADSTQFSGLSAGGASDKWNAWGSLSGDRDKYDGGRVSANPTQSFHTSASVLNTVLGADYLLAPDLTAGASIAVNRGTGSATSLTGATLQNENRQQSSGYTVAPYFAWQFAKNWALDASMGWGVGRLESVTVSAGGGTASANASRFFYGTNLSYTAWEGNWQLTGKGSYLYGDEKYADVNSNFGTLQNSAVKNKLAQARIGGQAGYWMDGIMPYVGLAYSSDMRSSSADTASQEATADLGKNAFVWSIGANFISLKNSMTGGIVFSQETGRDASKRDSVMANINFRF